jgi:hypothetical protein
MSGRIDPERFERLIRAIEAQTNAINRLVQVIERKHSAATKKTRQRRVIVPPDRPIKITPLVEATVARALARHGHG